MGIVVVVMVVGDYSSLWISTVMYIHTYIGVEDGYDSFCGTNYIYMILVSQLVGCGLFLQCP